MSDELDGRSGICSLRGALRGASHRQAPYLSPARVAQWIEHRPMKQVGACRRRLTHVSLSWMFLPLCPSPFLSHSLKK